MMTAPYFRCIKTNTILPMVLNYFNNPEVNGPNYTNVVLEGGYKVSGYKSLVPFKKIHFDDGARNTPLLENKDISQLVGIKNFYIKDESTNPYGTHKDRRSAYIINVAIEHKVDKIVCLTAGNAGYSLSRYCSRAKIDYTSLLFPWVSEKRKDILKERGNVITIDGTKISGILRPRDFKQIVEEHDKYERKKEWKNTRAVTNSFDPISINAHKELFYEIKDKNPDYVVVPCGSGDVIIGIWLAIKELGLSTKIIGVGPKGSHPLFKALYYGVDEVELSPFQENSVADKLSTPFTAVLPILYKIFSEEGNIYTEVGNEEIVKTKKILEEYGIKCEYSSSVVFATFLGNERPTIPEDAIVIAISTGKGIES